MEGLKVLSVSDLLQRSRPLTATSSLDISSSTPPHFPHRPISRPSLHTPPSPRILQPLKYPAILIGTVNLSHKSNPKVPNSCALNNYCFSFSDGGSTVCCAILDLKDFRIVGKKIYVLAWNFIPFKSNGGGLLEIIRWKYPESTVGINNPSPVISASSSTLCDNPAAHSRIHGRLESVSPVLSTPCTIISRSFCTDTAQSISADGGNLIGFLAEITICGCSTYSNDDPIEGQSCHSFTKPVFVYFCGPASTWRPLLSKLLCRVVSITGLKKKLIVLQGEESSSYIMFVTKEQAALHLSMSLSGLVWDRRKASLGRGETGRYTGIVTGIYYQGLAVELDEKVWLLLTDHVLVPPHSLRVGALISLSEVHFIYPNFSWVKMILLGGCLKTNIDVKTFSPLETQSQLRPHIQSLLAKFIESLTFSARLWALLTVSCFKRKFAGTLSEKEILGSQHKEGLAQKYATSSLPSSAFHTRHGLFTEFCKHDSGICSKEPNFGPLKLAVPMSNFISKCQSLWVDLQSQKLKDTEASGINKYPSSLSCEGKSYPQWIRRIISSEVLGVVLVGTLKICPTSGRLQLVDATGCIDVVIPDFLSHDDVGNLYEVKDYKLVLEGLPLQVNPLEVPKNEAFSCRSIFQHAPLKRELNHLTVYIYLCLRNATCLNVSLSLSKHKDKSDDFKAKGGRIYHLLLLTHKFPAIDSLQDNLNISNRSSLFAEAIVLPYNLFLLEENCDGKLLEYSGCNLKAPSESEKKDYLEKLQFKRQKITHSLDGTFPLSCRNNLEATGTGGSVLGEKKPSNAYSSPEIPCFIIVRSVNDEGLLVPGVLFNVNSKTPGNVADRPSAWKVELEFKSESFNMYQVLQIGVYYIMKCAMTDLMCNLKDHIECADGDKVLVTSQTPLWSFSFSSIEVLQQIESPQDCTSVISSVRNDGPPFRNAPHDELLFYRSLNPIGSTVSDFNKHLFAEVTCLTEALIDELARPFGILREVVSVSECIQTMMEAPQQPSRHSVCEYKLPEGNLVSVYGNVLDVHGRHASDTNLLLRCKNIGNFNHRVFQEVPNNICIHVCEGHYMVRIHGSIGKLAYPIGLGPGVHATFYRVLMTRTSSRQFELMLTPSSFIVINSIKEVDHMYSDKCATAHLDPIPVSLISRLMIKCLESKPLQFRCRVLAVHILVLESRTCRVGKPKPEEHSRKPIVRIPLAGFVLDDGSSLCCCWADAERAETLLWLHNTTAGAFSNSISCGSLKIKRNNSMQNTTTNDLEKLLTKHHRIRIKNSGAMVDSSCLDFSFSVNSSQVLSSSDESLLKFIFLNACRGSVMNVVGSLMNSDAIRCLERELIEMQVTVQSMQNIWASEVRCVDPLTEARSILKEIGIRMGGNRKIA